MNEYEIKQIQDYLNKNFLQIKFLLKKSIDDSCEIFLNDEFIGLVYLEERMRVKFHISFT